MASKKTKVFFEHPGATKLRYSKHTATAFQRSASHMSDFMFYVKMGLWDNVLSKLQEDAVSDAERKTAVQEAVDRADDEHLSRILPFCTRKQLESAINAAVARGLWTAVRNLLQRGTRDSLREWVVEEAGSRASESELLDILSYRTRGQFQCLMLHAVRRKHWLAAKTLVSPVLPHCTVTDTQLHKVVLDIINTDVDLSSMQSLPQTQFLDTLLTEVLKRDLWSTVDDILSHGVPGPFHKRAVEEASNRVSESDFIMYILPNCMAHELNSVLKVILTRQLWTAVSQLILRCKATTSQVKWVVEEASKHAPERRFIVDMLPHCTFKEVHAVLENLVHRGQWFAVDRIICKYEIGVAESRRVIESPGENAPPRYFAHLIGRHGFGFRDSHRHSRSKVEDVLLAHDIKRQRTEYEHIHIPEHNSPPEDEELDPSFSEIVAKGLWHVVDKYLSAGVSDKQHRWAVEEAGRRADQSQFKSFILRHCRDDELDDLLAVMVRRRFWCVVGKLCERGVSDSVQNVAVQEASQYASSYEIVRFVVPHCTPGQLDSVCDGIIRRKLWAVVIKSSFLAKISNTQFRRICKECINHIGRSTLEDFLKSRDESDDFDFSERQLAIIWDELLRGGFWREFGPVLRQLVMPFMSRDGEIKYEDAIEHFDDKTLSLFTSHCPDDHVESLLRTLVGRGYWLSVYSMLTCHEVNASLHSLTVRKAAEEIFDDSLLSKFFKLRSLGRDLEHAMKESVHRGMWMSLSVLLEQNNAADLPCEWAVKAAIERADDFTLSTILDTAMQRKGHADDLLDYALSETVRKWKWLSVEAILRSGVSDAQRRWSVEEAVRRCPGVVFIHEILPYCADDQLDSILIHCVERKLWRVVGQLLGRAGISRSTHQWAAEQYFPHATHADLKMQAHSLSRTDGSYAGLLFPELVKHHLWHEVKSVLEAFPISDAQRSQAVILASEYAAESDEATSIILQFCDCDQLEAVLQVLLKKRAWLSIIVLLKRGPSRDIWQIPAVDKVSKHADVPTLTKHILPHCDGDQLHLLFSKLLIRAESDSDVNQVADVFVWADKCSEHVHWQQSQILEDALVQAVTRGLWIAVSVLLMHGMKKCHRTWAIVEASKQATEDVLIFYIIFHCSVDDKYAVLKELMKRNLWAVVGQLLKSKCGNILRTWAIWKASKVAAEHQIIQHILPYVEKDDFMLHTFLKEVTRRELWGVVSWLLPKCCSQQRRWVYTEIFRKVTDEDLTNGIDYVVGDDTFPEENVDDTVSVMLPEAVRRGQWHNAMKLLALSVVTHEQRRYAAEEAFANAYDLDHFTIELLLGCPDHHLDAVFSLFLEKEAWVCIGKLLQRRMGEEEKTWIRTHAETYILIKHVLPECAGDQLHFVFSELLTRDLNETQTKQVAERFVQQDACGVEANQTGQYLQSALRLAIQRRLWCAVGVLLRHSISDAERTFTIKEAAENADDSSLMAYVIPKCIGNEILSKAMEQRIYHTTLISVLVQETVKRGLWQPVNILLWHEDSDTERRWAVQEASKRASEDDLIHYIFLHVARDQFDDVVAETVRRGLWRFLNALLKHEPGVSNHDWAVDEAVKNADEEQLLLQILNHCDAGRVDFVLTQLTERRYWKAVAVLLERTNAQSLRQWVVTEASKHADGEQLLDIVDRHCDRKQLEHVFTETVNRGQWSLVVNLIDKQNISEMKRRWAVEEAGENADDSVLPDILRRCEGDQMESLIQVTVRRQLWRSVETLLEHACDKDRRLAVEKAVLCADACTLRNCILLYCEDDQLSHVLSVLVQRGLWSAISLLLESRKISEKEQRQVVEEACARVEDINVANFILQHCFDDQLESLLTIFVRRGLWCSVAKALKRGASESNIRWAVEEAGKYATGLHINNILSYCVEDQAESVLQNLVRRELWCTVRYMLERFGLVKHEWVVEEAWKHRGDFALTDIVLPHCPANLTGSLLSELTNRELWPSVGRLLSEHRVTDSQLTSVSEKASESASDSDLTQYIIPYCPNDLLGLMLPGIVKRRMWRSVGVLLRRGVSRTNHVWATVEASKHADASDFIRYIIPSLQHKTEVDAVVTNVVSRGLWEAFGQLFLGRVAQTEYGWAIEEASKHASSYDLIHYILPLSSVLQHETIVVNAVSRGLWAAVGELLKREITASKRTWAVSEAGRHAAPREITNRIYPFCTDSEKESLFRNLVERGLWSAVSRCHSGVGTKLRIWGITQSIRLANDAELSQVLLSGTKELIDSVVETLNASGALNLYCRVIKIGLFDRRHSWPASVIRHASDSDLQTILSCCTRRQKRFLLFDIVKYKYTSFIEEVLQHVDSELQGKLLDHVLVYLITEGQWQLAGQLLSRGPSAAVRKRIFKEASIRADCQDLLSYILPHCPDEHVDLVLTHVTERRLWVTFSELLPNATCGIRSWAIAEASKYAAVDDLRDMLPFCEEEDADVVLTHLIKRGLWLGVSQLLPQGRPKTVEWAIVEASKRAGDEYLLNCILPVCNDNRSDLLLTSVVRGMWRVVDKLMSLGISKRQQQWVFREAGRHADSDDLLSYLIPHCKDCRRELVEMLLTCVTQRDRWRVVGELLSCGVSEANHNWAVKEACLRAHGVDLLEIILPHCTGELVEVMLTHATERRMWCVVEELLSCSVSKSKHRWVVEEACESANDTELMHILPHCTYDDEVRLVTKTAVNRRLWKTVGTMLHKGVDSATNTWAVIQASKHAEELELIDNILPFCTDDSIGPVLTVVLERNLLRAVLMLIPLKLSHTQRTWAVEKAMQHVDESDVVRYILPHCNADLIEYLILPGVIRRGMWNVSLELLQYPLSDTQRRCVLSEAVSDGNDNIRSSIVTGCADDDLEFLLTYTVEKGLWSTVALILQRGVASRRRDWAVEEATKRADAFTLERHILVHCADSQLDAALRNIVSRRFWVTASVLLRRRTSEPLKLWAVHEACIHCSHFELSRLVTLCSEEYLLLYFKEFLKRGLTEKIPFCLNRLVPRVTLSAMVFFWAHYFVNAKELSIPEFKDSEVFIRKLSDCSEDVPSETRIQGPREKFARHERLANQWQMSVATFYGNPRITTDSCKTFRRLFLEYLRKRGDSCGDQTLLELFIVMPVILHSLSKTDGLPSQALMSCLCEDTRRFILMLSIEQGEWKLVSQLADHTVYDDQRGWALGEAFWHRQWDTFMVLAEHGLTDDQLRRVYRQIAKHADWEIVLQLFERGADVHHVREELETANPCRDRNPDEKMIEKYKRRCLNLLELEHRLSYEAQNFDEAVMEGNWRAVLYYIRHEASHSQIQVALETALEQNAWHVVIHLIRKELDISQRRAVFSVALREKQWGVIRVLLERGVGFDLCRAVLQDLIKERQWLIVARVAEYGFSDRDRRMVMQEAMKWKEGSVVAHIVSIMQGRLTVEERDSLFQQATSKGVWEAIKRLVEETDSTGVRQRDSALRTAVSCHRWDVVEHCQRYEADIDMRGEKHETLLHMAARLVDWSTVTGLVCRGANQFLPDSEHFLPLHRAVNSCSWSAAKVLVEFHGDINEPDPAGETPLFKMIQNSQAMIIDCSLLWGRDVGRRIACKGKTALHVVCEAGLVDSIRYFVARGCDPLAVTEDGKTMLRIAAENEFCPRELIAECIKLGVSTHQPSVSDSQASSCFQYKSVSPVACAVWNDDVDLLEALYESGSCSNQELYELSIRPPFCPPGFASLKRMATTPRKLQSLCRLVIAHHINVCKPRTREKKVKCLPRRRISDAMIDYVLFSDVLKYLSRR